MSRIKIGKFTTNYLVTKILSWSTRIFFIASIITLACLSFVDKFNFIPGVKSLAVFGLVSMVLNMCLWEMYFRSCYERHLALDMENTKYSVHKRYYFARSGWKYVELQEQIRHFNKDFIKAWEGDVEDITGRTIEEIKRGKYKGNHYKRLIWRIKKHRYPTTGIKTPNDVLYILSVGASDGMRINIKKAEHMHSKGLIIKIITSVAGSFLAASFGYEFIDGSPWSALIKLLISIMLILMSVFMGSKSGIESAKIKLATTEAISERLEEWRAQIPTEVPYNNEDNIDTEIESAVKEPVIAQSTIEIV